MAEYRTGVGIVARLGGIPLYAAVLLQGLPLDRQLTSLRSRLEQDDHQQLVERVTTLGPAQSLVPALVWTAIYIFAFFLISRRSSCTQLRHLLQRQWPLVALVAYALMSVFWSPNIGKVLSGSFHAAGITLVAMAAAIRCASHMPSFVKTLSLCLGGNLMLHLLCVAIAPQIGIAADGRWMGMAAHSNTLGTYALVGVWAGTVAYLINRGASRRVAFGVLAVSTITLIGSGSTTSLLTAGFAVWIALLIRFSAKWSPSLRQFANVAFGCALVGFIIAFSAFGSLLVEVTAWLGKSSDFTGREVIWQEAWRLIGEHPLLGWGFDDNARVIVETGFIHSGYHNGYLDLAVRGGSIAILIIAIVLLRWWQDFARSGRGLMQICVPIVTAFITHNLMEASIFSPRNLIWMMFLVMMFTTALAARRRISARQGAKFPPAFRQDFDSGRFER